MWCVKTLNTLFYLKLNTIISKGCEYDNSVSYSAPGSNVNLWIERVWKPNHAKPAQASVTIILRGHISTKVRIPGTGYLLCAGKLEQIIYLVYMWLREQSDVGEVHPNALCGITVAVLWLSACVLSATPDTPLRCSSLPSTHHHTALPWRSGRAKRDRGLFCSSIFKYSFVFAVCNSLF